VLAQALNVAITVVSRASRSVFIAALPLLSQRTPAVGDAAYDADG